MNTQTNERAPVAGAQSEKSFVAGDNSNPKPKDQKVQEIIAALQRDYVAEALRIAALKASHAADDVSIGDDDCAERGVRIAIQNLREAATAFRHLQKLIDASALREGSDQ